MDREPIGIGRLPASGCQAIISAIIGVDLPMPEKTHVSGGAMAAGLAVASPLLSGIQRKRP